LVRHSVDRVKGKTPHFARLYHVPSQRRQHRLGTQARSDEI
jgi:hypothetical protein